MRKTTKATCNRRGAIAIMAAVVLIILIVMIAFGVDVGIMMLDRTNAQIASDAASLAATGVLSDGGTEAEMRQAAKTFLTGNGVSADAADVATIEAGKWDADARTFQSAAYADANAIRVAITDASRPTFFGKIFQNSSFAASAAAIAATTGAAPQDIMMVIDCSTSMSSHNRMTYTRGAATVLVNEIKATDRLGLAIYSWPDPLDGGRKTGHLETNLSLDHGPTAAFIPTLVPGYYGSGTNIAGGMRVGIQELASNPRVPPETVEQVMVVLTDGRANKTEPPGTDEWNSIAHYASVAAANNIKIHAITLGSNASEAAMQSAASVTGGEYHHIPDGDYAALVDLFKKIARGDGTARLVD